MRRITRSAKAKQDLVGIWDYLAQDDFAAADRVLQKIDRKILMLLTLPYMGRPREEIAPGTRGMICEPYLILYRVNGDEIEIVRVIHGRRDLRDLV